MKHGIAMTLVVEPGARIEITTDERKLKQIMFNLLSNAVKFTPEGGAVSVRARLISDLGLTIADLQSEIKNRKSTIRGNFVEISVEDTGIGIKPGDMERLFRPFSQLESAYTKTYEGTGLGLELSKRLVEFLGGRMRVESEFGKGSTFTFVIPIQVETLSRREKE
jgi:signal transduction histidine kinase